MLFLGDIHGAFEYIPKYRGAITQVGDLGIGFGKLPEFRDDFRFIRGNHDNPELCQHHPNYIGDWKLIGNVLYLSGAFSIDKNSRIPYVSWWPKEELTVSQMYAVLKIDKDKVKYVVSHDCPAFCYKELGVTPPVKRTPIFLDVVAETFNPHKWVHGHHHKSKKYTLNGIQFTSLGVGEVKDVEFESQIG